MTTITVKGARTKKEFKAIDKAAKKLKGKFVDFTDSSVDYSFKKEWRAEEFREKMDGTFIAQRMISLDEL